MSINGWNHRSVWAEITSTRSAATWTGFVLLLIVSAPLTSTHASAETQGPTLERVVDSLVPRLNTTVLSAIYVRTYYFPQALDDRGEPRVRRTTVSEVLANSSVVRESLSDTRLVRSQLLDEGDRTKHFAFHYADDGRYLRAYDGKWNVGAIRTSPRTRDRNFLTNILDPLAAGNENKFISRAIPFTFLRLRRAHIVAETRTGDLTRVEGEYREGDPERFFSMTIVHSRNAFIQELREYDKDKRILSEMKSEGMAEIPCSSCTLVLPKTRVVKKYRYDDLDGNSCQIAILDILEPTEKALDSQKFSFRFPEGARVFDMVAALHSDQLQSIGLSAAHDLLKTDAFMMTPEEGPGADRGKKADAASLPAEQKAADGNDLIGSDPTASTLMARVREAYARDTSGPSGGTSDLREKRGLQLPTPNYGRVLARKAVILVVGAGVFILAIRFACRRILGSADR